jgi:opacity protein-like surface antigen
MARILAGFFVTATIFVGAAPAHAESYFSVYTGSAFTRDSDLTISQPATASAATYSGVSWDTRSLEMPPYYGLRLDHFLDRAPNFGVGVEFNHYKVYADTGKSVPVNGTWNGAAVSTVAPLNQRVQKFNISHGVNYVGLNLLYRWRTEPGEPFPRGRLQPYVGGGPVLYIVHGENAVNNLTNDEKYQGSGWGYQLFGGLRYGLTPRVSLMVEGKYSHGTAKVDTAGAGTAETPLNTWHAAIGLSFRF